MCFDFPQVLKRSDFRVRKRETDKSYLPLSLCEDLSEAQQSSGAAADLKPAEVKWLAWQLTHRCWRVWEKGLAHLQDSLTVLC